MSDQEDLPVVVSGEVVGEIVPAGARTLRPGTVDAVLELRAPTGDTVSELISSWLGGFTTSVDTRDAYRRDLKHYIAWTAEMQLDPLRDVRLPQARMYAAWLATTPSPTTGKVRAPRAQARLLSAASSWYGYVVQAEARESNPFAHVPRPGYDRRHSPTSSVTRDQTTAMIAAPHKTAAAVRDREPPGPPPLIDRWCATLVLGFLFLLGIRVSEVCNLNLGDVGQEQGIRTLEVRMKGGKVRKRAIPVQLSPIFDRYLAHRRPDPADPDAQNALLLTRTGHRITRHQVSQWVRRAAKEAGVPTPEKITPHSGRHSFNTLARELGVDVEARRDALGHSSTAITQLYDHVSQSVPRDPAHLVAAAAAPDFAGQDLDEGLPVEP